MDYKETYNKLINKRLEHPITKADGYCETHHIIPKSEGGTNEKANLVNLTAREHYIAHLLLAKIYDDANMACALVFMKSVFDKGDNKIKVNGRLFEKMRLRAYKLDSQRKKEHPTKHWLGKKFSDETKRKMAEKRKGKKPHLGIEVSDDSKEKISGSLKTYYDGLSFDERRAIYGKSNKGKHWYNNGIENVKAFVCPVGFVRGRLKWKN